MATLLRATVFCCSLEVVTVKGYLEDPHSPTGVRPIISHRNFLTSHTSLGSFPIREVKLYVPRAIFCGQGSNLQGSSCHCHLAHTPRDHFGPSRSWWAHRRGIPCCLFRLFPPGPHGKRPDHQALGIVRLQARLQEGALTCLWARKTQHCILYITHFKVSWLPFVLCLT